MFTAMVFVLGTVFGGSVVAWFKMGDKVVAVEEKVVDKAKDLVNK